MEKDIKTKLQNKLAQKLFKKGSINLNGIDVKFWTGQNRDYFASNLNWNKIKACSFYNQYSEGNRGHIVVTGVMQIPRNEILEYAAKSGYKVHSNVTLETNMIILGSENVSPTKIAKAFELIEKGYKIEFLDETAFLEMIIDNCDIDDLNFNNQSINVIDKEINTPKIISKKEVVVKKEKIIYETINNKLNGQLFVISGTFDTHSRDELKKLIEQNGGKNIGSISGKTSYLLAGENIGPSKLTKAEKLQIPIISESDFIEMIK